MSPRRSRLWPARNTDDLAQHVARQIPELTRRQAMTAMNVAMQGVRKSLCDQAEAGAETPYVKIRHVGVFELRRYKPTRRPRLDGVIQEIPSRWRMVFRPCALWQDYIQALDETRQSLEEEPGQSALEEVAWPQPPAVDEEEGTAEVSDV